MHKLISFYLLTTLVAHALPQQVASHHLTPHSIRVHAITDSGGNTLRLTVVSKPTKGIRATIHPEGKYTRAVVLYTEDKIYLIQDDPKAVKELHGDDAAKNLFEMLALSPDFYFLSNKAILDTKILDGYSIHLNRQKNEEDDDDENTQPISAQLYLNADSKLLRTIRYVDFFPKDEFDYYQPKELVFSDHDTDQEGTISIHQIDYNVGIGDFVFQAPDRSKN